MTSTRNGRRPAAGTTWEQLDATTRQRFGAYLVLCAERYPDGHFEVTDADPRVENGRTIIPFRDRNTGKTYEATVNDDGAIEAKET